MSYTIVDCGSAPARMHVARRSCAVTKSTLGRSLCPAAGEAQSVTGMGKCPSRMAVTGVRVGRSDAPGGEIDRCRRQSCTSRSGKRTAEVRFCQRTQTGAMAVSLGDAVVVRPAIEITPPPGAHDCMPRRAAPRERSRACGMQDRGSRRGLTRAAEPFSNLEPLREPRRLPSSTRSSGPASVERVRVESLHDRRNAARSAGS